MSTFEQTSLRLPIEGHTSLRSSVEPRRRPRLGLLLDTRAWLEWLADDWWPLDDPGRVLHLGLGAARGDLAQNRDRAVIAWIEPDHLPAAEVLTWRAEQWQIVSTRELTDDDEEIVWRGPLPLFAVTAFSVASEDDRLHLRALASSLSNLSLPNQQIRVDVLGLRPARDTPSAASFPAVEDFLIPPSDWDALRGAAAMAVWAVPVVAPWLDLLCDALAMNTGETARRLGVPWWAEPPWRRTGDDEQTRAPLLALWRAALRTLRRTRLRESWRPQILLGEIEGHALELGHDPAALADFMGETRALLRDERRVDVTRGTRDPLGLALQLVLLRHTPDRFVSWSHEFRGLGPAVWWTGATLSGLIRGYRELDPKFRGTSAGRRLLALRTWACARPTSSGRAWPGLPEGGPTWTREQGKVYLRWDNELWDEKVEKARGKWYFADLDEGENRSAALDLVRRLNPACLRRTLKITNASLGVRGSGTIRSDKGRLLIEGTTFLDLPAGVLPIDDLDPPAFRDWIACAGISEHLVGPPHMHETPPRATQGVVVLRSEPETPLVGEVPGLRIVQNFLSEGEEAELLEHIAREPWLSELARRVQHYGWKYDYKARKVDPSARLGPLPDWVLHLAERLLAQKLVSELPDQAIVNEYIGEQGISKHVDCIPCFRGAIVTLSLQEPWEMVFRGPHKEKIVRTLDRRSATIMVGDARLRWTHEIPRRKKESWGPRGCRVSLTFRKVNL